MGRKKTARSGRVPASPRRRAVGWGRLALLARLGLVAWLLLVAVFLAVPGRAEAARPVEVLVNGRGIAADVAPYVDDNYRTMVPIRFVAEALGAVVGWDEASGSAFVSLGQTRLKLTVGSRRAVVNDTQVELDTTVVKVRERVIVPLRFVAETLGAQVDWRPQENVVNVVWSGPGSAGGQEQAVVSGSLVNLRRGPATTYDVVAQLPRGTVVTIRGDLGGWREVALAGGLTGWISADLLTTADSSPTEAPGSGSLMAVIAVDVANIRSGPATTYPMVGQARRNLQMDILEETGGWYGVQLPSGVQGWVAGSLAVVRVKFLASRGGDAGRGDRQVAGLEGASGEVPAGGVEVTGFAVEPTGEGLAVRVSGSDNLAYAVQVIKNPLRLILDIQGATLNLAGQDPLLPVQHPLARQVRAGQFQGDVVRLVVDLLQPVSYQVQSLAPGELRISLSPASFQGRTVVIDPGHGSLQPGGWSDPGAIGAGGLRERDVVIGIARYLADLLAAGGAEVILTRTGDTGLSLAERAAVANRAGADAFISIHANSSTDSRLSGSSTYYYAPAGGQLSGQRATRQHLARSVQEALVAAGGRKDLGIMEQNLAVLRETRVPSILVETAFVSNPEEERLLADPAFQQKLARGIADGLLDYFLDSSR